MKKISCFADEISPVFSDQLRVMKNLNLRFFEVRTVNDINVMNFSNRTCREIRKQADDNGMTITCVSSPIGKEKVSFPVAESVESVKRAAEIADIFGCRYIRIFSFFKEEGLDNYGLSLKSLSAMAKAAEECGTTLVMEGGHNTVGGLGETSERLFKEVNSPALRCAFDAAAFIGEGDKPYENCLGRLMPYIEYVHIKDGRYGDSQKYVVGEGDAQYEKIFNAIKDKDLIFSLEPHLQYAGAKRGFSGEEEFCRAYRALISMLKKLNIEYN